MKEINRADLRVLSRRASNYPLALERVNSIYEALGTPRGPVAAKANVLTTTSEDCLENSQRLIDIRKALKTTTIPQLIEGYKQVRSEILTASANKLEKAREAFKEGYIREDELQKVEDAFVDVQAKYGEIPANKESEVVIEQPKGRERFDKTIGLLEKDGNNYFVFNGFEKKLWYPYMWQVLLEFERRENNTLTTQEIKDIAVEHGVLKTSPRSSPSSVVIGDLKRLLGKDNEDVIETIRTSKFPKEVSYQLKAEIDLMNKEIPLEVSQTEVKPVENKAAIKPVSRVRRLREILESTSPDNPIASSQIIAVLYKEELEQGLNMAGARHRLSIIMDKLKKGLTEGKVVNVTPKHPGRRAEGRYYLETEGEEKNPPEQVVEAEEAVSLETKPLLEYSPKRKKREMLLEALADTTEDSPISTSSIIEYIYGDDIRRGKITPKSARNLVLSKISSLNKDRKSNVLVINKNTPNKKSGGGEGIYYVEGEISIVEADGQVDEFGIVDNHADAGNDDIESYFLPDDRVALPVARSVLESTQVISYETPEKDRRTPKENAMLKIIIEQANASENFYYRDIYNSLWKCPEFSDLIETRSLRSASLVAKQYLMDPKEIFDLFQSAAKKLEADSKLPLRVERWTEEDLELWAGLQKLPMLYKKDGLTKKLFNSIKQKLRKWYEIYCEQNESSIYRDGRGLHKLI